MTNPTPVAGSTIIPTIRYLDAPTAIEWLCRAFGFERHAVYEDGNGMIMPGSLRDDAWGERTATPSPARSAAAIPRPAA